MPKKFVEDDNTIPHQKNTEDVDSGKISKKTKEKFESLLKFHSSKKFWALLPFITTILIFIIQLIYFKFNIHEIINGDLPDMIIPSILLTIILFLFFLYDEYKYKRLYKQVYNGTIIIKQVEIIKFKRYRPRLFFKDSKDEPDKYGYHIIASDGIKKYKSKKFTDEELGLNERYNTGYLRLDFILNLVISSRIKRKSLKIRKTYYIGDKITVYIDSGWNNNYYVDI